MILRIYIYIYIYIICLVGRGAIGILPRASNWLEISAVQYGQKNYHFDFYHDFDTNRHALQL